MGENECNEETAFYKEKITEMVVKCDNERFLKFLYNTILSFKKKVGHLVPLFFMPIGYIVKYSLSMFFAKFH